MVPHGCFFKDVDMNLMFTVRDFEEAAMRNHRKLLQFQTFFDKGTGRKPTKQQWQKRFAKDNNAMDTTPGRTRARAALSEDEMAQLRREGKCFKCKRQGHIGRNCPNQTPQVRATTTTTISSGATETPVEEKTNDPGPSTSSIKKITAQELVGLVRDMDQGEKDKVIQNIFMNEDFA